MFTTAAKNAMLDALSIAYASLHTDFPGQTGANEVSGGSPAYARKAVTAGAASSEQRALTGAVAFDVPTVTIRWVGFWDSAQSRFQCYAPNGGTPKEFVADADSDTIWCPAHGFANGDKVVFYNGIVPVGLTEAAVYYVRFATVDTFKVATSASGAAIDLTSAGSSACLVSPITEDVYSVQGIHALSAGTFSLGL